MKILLFVFALLLIAFPVAAQTTLTFGQLGGFDLPGDIGKSDSFTKGVLTLTATGYSTGGVQTDMFDKQTGPVDFGLGLNANGEHEIAGPGFIQLDLSKIEGLGVKNVTLGIDSLDAGESFDIYGSNVAGSKGVLLASNVDPGGEAITFTESLGPYKYISIGAGSGSSSVLIDLIRIPAVAPTPEASSGILALIGVCGLFIPLALRKKA